MSCRCWLYDTNAVHSKPVILAGDHLRSKGYAGDLTLLKEFEQLDMEGEIFVSPRPLYATHLLKVSPRNNDAAFVTIPINDLLFTLNVPNLGVTWSTSAFPSGGLPRRLDDNPQCISMQVPHLETFPELVRYIHSKDQDHFFRELIPQWMTSLIYPLPECPKAIEQVSALPCKNKIFKIFRKIIPCLNIERNFDLEPSPTLTPKRTVESVAIEITRTLATMRDYGMDDVLLITIRKLQALRDNLSYIGYVSDGQLWAEMDITCDIVVRALSLISQVRDDSEERATW